jgi:hypothetical protein
MASLSIRVNGSVEAEAVGAEAVGDLELVWDNAWSFDTLVGGEAADGYEVLCVSSFAICRHLSTIMRPKRHFPDGEWNCLRKIELHCRILFSTGMDKAIILQKFFANPVSIICFIDPDAMNICVRNQE